MKDQIKERPIIFNQEMILSILAGRKSQTRRAANIYDNDPKPSLKFLYMHHDFGVFANRFQEVSFRCPYGKVGDRLWVQETIYYNVESANFYYRADNKGVGTKCYSMLLRAQKHKLKKIQSNHLPRWASRITLEITSIRVEKVQSISMEDAIKEGCDEKYTMQMEKVCEEASCNGFHSGATWHFHKIWNSINEKKGFGWSENPWTWCISFKVVKP